MQLGEEEQKEKSSTDGTLALQPKPDGLLSRSFQGLVVALGETAPSKVAIHNDFQQAATVTPPPQVVEGQNGIARGYTTEVLPLESHYPPPHILHGL